MKRRLLFWLLVAAFLWVIISRSVEINALIRTILQGQWQWVLLAAALQCLYYLAFSASYQAAFETVGVRSRISELLPLVLGSLFVNVVAPSGGAAGAALFVDDATRRRESPGRAAAGALLQQIAYFVAFALILVSGMAYLFLRRELHAYEVGGAIFLLLAVLAQLGILLLAHWRPDLVIRLLNWVESVLNSLSLRLRHRPLFPQDWAAENAAEFVSAAAAIFDHPDRLGRTLGILLLVHLIDMASLYVLFWAFRTPIALGPLIAGYAMGMLFWVVSPTPQGIGVVEGVMALIYTSVGIPAATSTAVVLSFRGLTFWLPFTLGFILLRRSRSFATRPQARPHPPAGEWRVRLAALLAAAVGVANLVSGVTPALPERVRLLRPILPLLVRRGGRLTATLAGFALLLLADSLWRRKRIAWLLALLALLVSAASHLVKGLDYEEALLSAGVATLLFSLRPYFHARSDPPSVLQGLRVLLAALLFTLAYGVTGFYLLDRHFRQSFDLWQALRQTVTMFTQFYNPGLQPLTGFGRYFAASIYLVGALTLAYALFMLVRPVLLRQPASPQERQRAAAIVSAYGRSSLARYTLFLDKAYFFSPGGSLIAFMVRGRTALALGDPIGPPEDFSAAIAGFQRLCSENDWLPAFYQTLPDHLEAYRLAGFGALCIGQEAIVDLHTFSTDGHEKKDLRTAFNRLSRLGSRVEIHQPPLPDALLGELRAVSDEWLTIMRGSEKRFSMGWFDDDYLRLSQVAALHTAEGAISAFANLVPEYQRNELALDLMRRRQRIEPGSMDFLFVSLFAWARQQGFDSFNLGLSSLSGVGQNPGDPAVERALHFIYEHANQFYHFKGLHEFKEKFQPLWSPRYLVYPAPASLLQVVAAVAEANSGEDGLPWRLLRLKRSAPADRTALRLPGS